MNNDSKEEEKIQLTMSSKEHVEEVRPGAFELSEGGGAAIEMEVRGTHVFRVAEQHHNLKHTARDHWCNDTVKEDHDRPACDQEKCVSGLFPALNALSIILKSTQTKLYSF